MPTPPGVPKVNTVPDPCESSPAYPPDLRALTSLRIFLAVGVVLFHFQLQTDHALGYSAIVERSRLAFSALNDELRYAALIAQGRELDPDEMRRACQYAFDHIFAI